MDHAAHGTQLETALEPMRRQLSMDGYDLRAELTADDVLKVVVTAGEDACEDCLVPRDVFATMLADQVASAGVAVGDVDVAYPVDH